MTVNFEMPTLFSKSRSHDNQLEKVKAFFHRENGSIAISQAVCSTHRVDVSPRAPKKALTWPFIEAVKGLYMV